LSRCITSPLFLKKPHMLPRPATGKNSYHGTFSPLNLTDTILSIDHNGILKNDITLFLNDKNYIKETKYNKIITYLFENISL
jgi:hypothetical protein